MTTHVVASVGWLGGVVVFLALAAIGLTSESEATVRGVYLVMSPAARLVLLPFASGALVTGVVSSLTSSWGLVRHYWVVVKLVINVFSVVVLVAYLRTFRLMADAAADMSVPLAAVRNPSPLVHAVLALVLLLGATVLGMYKPKGTTRFF